MQCTSPRRVGFLSDGSTLAWSQKNFSKEFAPFVLPCGKCINCRLEYSRQWAVRCVHEASMHEKNSFLTLTYDNEHLGNNRLDYSDFQLFMKKLRKTTDDRIGFFCTGEYGEKSFRKHWHACVFNFKPRDLKKMFTNARGDSVFESASLTSLWGKGHVSVGELTFESAGYCARYAAKKLTFGKDGTHELEPISKKSNKNAIGKAWIEKFWRDVFSYGRCSFKNSSGRVVYTTVPRYYEKWFKENHPEHWLDYVTRVKLDIIERASKEAEKERRKWTLASVARGPLKSPLLTPEKIRNIISNNNLRRLSDVSRF